MNQTTVFHKIATVCALGLFIFFFINLSSQVHCDGLDSTQEALEKLEPSNKTVIPEKKTDGNSLVPYLKYAVFFIVGVTIALLIHRSYFGPGGGGEGGA